MRQVVCLLIMVSLSIAQDTLFITTGVSYIGEIENNTVIVSKVESVAPIAINPITATRNPINTLRGSSFFIISSFF